MSGSAAVRVAAAAGFLAVALGAFGAHGLRTVLEANERVGTWETAVLYHLVHSLVLLLLATRWPAARGAWWSFLIGVLIFSGTLYVLSLTDARWLGAITPLGGVAFLVGWGWLAVKPGLLRPEAE